MVAHRLKSVPDDAFDITLDGGLYKRIMNEGEGEDTPSYGAMVQVCCVGASDSTTIGSTCIFKFALGDGTVIKGWDIAVATMCKGEVAEFFVGAGYAESDANPAIKFDVPAEGSLRFRFELLSWIEPRHDARYLFPAERIERASQLKAEATALFKEGDWAAARHSYSMASEHVSSSADFEADRCDAAVAAAATDLHHSCLLNEAQCSLKLADWLDVVTRCTAALGARQEGSSLPEALRAKAFFRRGLAHIKLADFSAARADLLAACKLEPRSREIREAYASIPQAEALAKAAERALQLRMIEGAGSGKRPAGVPADAVDVSGDGRLWRRVLAPGDESAGEPARGDEVQIHYVGTTLANGVRFTSSREEQDGAQGGVPHAFRIPYHGQPMTGLATAVRLMRKGEISELFGSSSDLGGDTRSLPAGTMVRFEVELLSWAEISWEEASKGGPKPSFQDESDSPDTDSQDDEGDED